MRRTIADGSVTIEPLWNDDERIEKELRRDDAYGILLDETSIGFIERSKGKPRRYEIDLLDDEIQNALTPVARKIINTPTKTAAKARASVQHALMLTYGAPMESSLFGELPVLSAPIESDEQEPVQRAAGRTRRPVQRELIEEHPDD